MKSEVRSKLPKKSHWTSLGVRNYDYSRLAEISPFGPDPYRDPQNRIWTYLIEHVEH
jgi:hypothetical protein